jgi:GNAT superfamily N-acetyltransferase
VTSGARLEPGDDTARAEHVLRPATAADLPICAGIWRTALNDYLVRLALEPIPDDLGAIHRLYAHLLATDPESFLVAERVGGGGARLDADGNPRPDADGNTRLDADGSPQLDAFIAVVRRDRLWYLSMLFVLPDAQARGLGRRLLAAVWGDDAQGADGAGAPLRDAFRATATDSIQPISNALYASLGIVPRMPLFRFVGRADRPAALPPLPPGVDVAAFDEIGADGDGIGSSALAAELGALDREVLGFERGVDHAFLVREGRRGFLYCDRSGAALGYGYTSEAGRVGPVVVDDRDLLGPVVGHLVTAIQPRGAFGIWVPGAAEGAVVPLLHAGFRIDGFPTILCWERPFADWSRAIPISPGLL